MKKLVFATGNAHKIAEVNRLLDGFYEVVPMAEVGITEDIPETADTLEGNALLKARYVYAHTGMDCFSEDTGLEVEALGGRPGVHSARYAGADKDAAANMRKLLQELEGQLNRRARFRTVIALILDGKEYLFEGIAPGHIATAPSGKKGFGYDPIFVPEGHERTFAEMTADEKNAISHRGKAVAQLVEFLQKQASGK